MNLDTTTESFEETTSVETIHVQTNIEAIEVNLKYLGCNLLQWKLNQNALSFPTTEFEESIRLRLAIWYDEMQTKQLDFIAELNEYLNK